MEQIRNIAITLAVIMVITLSTRFAIGSKRPKLDKILEWIGDRSFYILFGMETVLLILKK